MEQHSVVEYGRPDAHLPEHSFAKDDPYEWFEFHSVVIHQDLEPKYDVLHTIRVPAKRVFDFIDVFHTDPSYGVRKSGEKNWVMKSWTNSVTGRRWLEGGSSSPFVMVELIPTKEV